MRRQIFSIIAGGQGCGKSTFAKKLIAVCLKQNKPVLCVLPDDEEPIFWEIEEIEYKNDLQLSKELYNFKSGIKKVICDNEKMFNIIRPYFRNGLLVVDDARVYLSSRPEPFRKMAMRRRQSNKDILFICHGLSEIPPSCNTFITDIVLYETSDDYDRWNVTNPEKFIPIVSRINQIAKTNPHYSERIIIKNIKI